ncbi:hypothetical protein PHAMO_290095 [Magnetospirillum molischianum DSM 120]|uniref:Uncharacterized protein n=1 Tax=Magnetospirillum molischianum DSM 120 TaxID=1150626 RepID=H8FTV0_MAGML|nr:hypothetical protein PHAMO_290095 [Magnetospirillum molischianum DSM 120]
MMNAAHCGMKATMSSGIDRNRSCLEASESLFTHSGALVEPGKSSSKKTIQGRVGSSLPDAALNMTFS